MEITLQTLLVGKPTIINDKEFLATKEYVQPFLDIMVQFTKDFIVNVTVPSQLTLSGDNKNITYNKVWIQAIMPEEHNIDDYRETYGLCYALDVKTPVYKIYRAYKHKDNGNLCVFDPSFIVVKELKPKEKLEMCVTELMSKTSNFQVKLKSLKNTFASAKIKDIQEYFGSLVYKSILYESKNIGGKVKIASADVVKAFNDVYVNHTSKFYTGVEIEGSLHNYYSALCAKITSGKDIINRFEKTILAGMLFGIISNDSTRVAE